MSEVIHGCTGKLALPNAKIARERAQVMRNREKGLVVAYRCTHCRQWHIGGTEQRANDARSKDYKRNKAEASRT